MMRCQTHPASLLSVLACLFSGAAAASPYTLAARTTALQNSSFVPTSISTTVNELSHILSAEGATITPRPPPTNIPLSCYPPELQSTIPRWWGPGIADNKCTTAMADGCPIWDPCNITVGTVQLLYWSTAANETWSHPTTLYDSVMDYTFTYPSIYMIYHDISAYNSCNGNSRAPIGPTLTSAIQDWALTDVSTMIPHVYPEQPGSMTIPRQLTPADLYNCTSTSYTYTPSDTWGDPGPYATGHRCNPYISISTRVRWLGEPYWRSCGVDNVASRAWDPPTALKMTTPLAPFSNVNPATTTVPTAVPDTTPVPDPSPVSAADPPQQTVSVDTTIQNNAPSATNNDSPSPVATTTQPTTLADPTAQNTNDPPSPVVDPPKQTTTIASTAQENVPSQATNNNPTPHQKDPAENPNPATPTVGGSVATQSNTLNPIPGTTNTATIQKQGQGAGDPSATNSAAIPIIPNAGPAPSSTIQIADPKQPITYLGATLAFSSPLATISSLNAVLSYGSEGIVIQYPGGAISTIAVQAPSTSFSSSVSGTGKAGSSGTVGVTSSSTNVGGGGAAATIASVINGIINGSPALSTAVTNTVSGSKTVVGVGSGNSGVIVTATGKSAANGTLTAHASPSVVMASGSAKRKQGISWLSIGFWVGLGVL